MSKGKEREIKMTNKQIFDFFFTRFNDLEKKIAGYREEIVEFKDGVYDKMDAVYKEVLTFRDEEVMHQGGQDRIQEQVDDHENRIKKLERPPVTVHRIRK